ncbi:uncharacterized protein G2W53_040108 [Senna tora]|uniref:MULE transposase domain-containing protein n=1 Tax=Senna tora TaxID=362788 RepID=A0A834SUE7_9FABA|nr:uncharacterized protein G2W53_040108 [Senna tora]
MMTDGFTVCIYQKTDVCEESNGVAFRGNNFPIMTSLNRAIDFEGLMQVVHQTLRLQPYQQVSHLIYRMPYVSDGVRFFPCELMDDGGVNHMFVRHAICLLYLHIPVIEICAQITGVQQDSVGGDYIPEAPLQTVMSQEFLGSQPPADDDEYGGAITEVERLLSIPTVAPNDDIGDEEYEDQLMGNDIEDGDYEEEDPNNYEREDPYQYEEVDVGHIGSSSATEFRPTPHQSQINLSGVRGTPNDGDTSISTWTEDEDLRSELQKNSSSASVCTTPRVANGGFEQVTGWTFSRASTAIAKDHPKPDSDMIAGVIADLVAEKADIPISLVVETVKKARGFTVSYKKAWREKQKAIARVYGSWVASYDKLTGWMAAVQQAMPGTAVSFQTMDMPGDDNVDGTFLYGKYKHSLLIAMGQDENRNIVHVAFALVEGETESVLSWFLWRLREHVAKDQEVCLISDRGTGFLAALDNPRTGWRPPLGHNVFCIRHVASNLNSKFRNREIRALLMKERHEYTDCGCQRRLEAIRTLNKDVAR